MEWDGIPDEERAKRVEELLDKYKSGDAIVWLPTDVECKFELVSHFGRCSERSMTDTTRFDGVGIKGRQYYVLVRVPRFLVGILTKIGMHCQESWELEYKDNG